MNLRLLIYDPCGISDILNKEIMNNESQQWGR
jgi:hypothetical protein